MAVGDSLGIPAIRLCFIACRYPVCMKFSLFVVGLTAVSVLIAVSDSITVWFMMRKLILQDRRNYHIISPDNTVLILHSLASCWYGGTVSSCGFL
jgi:hypothetical protein